MEIKRPFFRCLPSPVRLKVASIYLAGAILLALISMAAGGAALLLWWGVVALASVAVIYAVIGPAGFQKRGGSHPLPVSILLAPFLLGARLHPRLRLSYAVPVVVRDNVWLGPLPFAHEMVRSEFAALVDMTAELSIAQGRWRYASHPCLDLVAPGPAVLMAAAHKIEAFRAGGGRVLVSCAMGRSRSASAVAAWLIFTNRAADTADAIREVCAARPQALFRPAHREALLECERLWRGDASARMVGS